MEVNRKTKTFREYRLKSYLNMNHYIIINGKEGQTHPHTWEFVFVIIVSGDEFVEFRTFENIIDQFLEKYQNQILNRIEPFDIIVPTVENVTDYFSEEVRRLLRKSRGELVSLEGSETPTRSYIVDFRNEADYAEEMENYEEEQITGVVQYAIDRIREKHKSKE